MARRLSRIKEIRELLEESWNYDRDNREEAEKDLLFRAGDQWPDDVRTAREAANRPCITVNKIGATINQVVNDIKQADLAIKARPADDGSDQSIADIYSGIIRQIQEQSGSTYVYSLAADHSTSCGIGHFRITTDYLDDAAFDQEILIEEIANPLSVIWDPASVKPDRSDAKFCFVIEKMKPKDFKKKYPKATAESVDVSFNNNSAGIIYNSNDEILVAEFWEKVPCKKKLALFEDGQTLDITDLDEFHLSMMPQPVAVRDVDTHRVQVSIMSGSEILDGPFDWAGKYIPIIPVIGDEVPVGTKVVRSGLVRHARDPQMLYNYFRSQAVESIAQAPKAPYIATAKQIGKYKSQWDSANVSPKPYLLYEHDEKTPGPPKRERPADPPAALWQEGALASEDIKATTGIYDASLGAKSNETSGKAILARQREGDVANYHYTDNLTRALKHAGRVLVDLIPKIYDTQRAIRIIGEDESEQFVPINQQVMGVDGEPVILNDLSVGRFDVKVSIGPSFTTKRIEAAESMVQFVQAVPQAGQVAGDLIAENMDWPGAEQLANRLKKMVPPQFLEGEEGQEPPQPDPMQQKMQQIQMANMETEAMKNQSEAMKTQAEAEGEMLDNIAKEVQLRMSI